MNQCRDRRPYQAGGAGDRTARRVVGVGSGNLAADPRIPMVRRSVRRASSHVGSHRSQYHSPFVIDP